MLTAYYDLAKCPPTFDVVSFLVQVARFEEDTAIEILPGPEGGFRKDRLWPPIQYRSDMLNRVVIPMCGMLPTVRRITVHHSRPPPQSPSFGYNEYSMHFSKFVECMRDGVRPLRVAAEKDDQLVTVTLRESEHWKGRNSKVDEWVKAAKSFGHRVVFIRDTLKADEPLDGETSPEASRSLTERARLYRSARCNLFVNNGPAWLAFALDAPALVIRPATEGISALYGREGWQRNGVEPGGQMPGAPSYQRLAWVDDTAENIVNEFRNFTREQA